MEKEIWKDVVGYEGLYQISNLGNLKSLEKIIHQRKRAYKAKEKIMKPNILTTGYYYANLYKNGVVKKYVLHRLVANAFLPNLLNKPEVNHIDGNKLNNCVSNLEWVTNKENVIHAIKTGLKKYDTQSTKIKQIRNGVVINVYNSIHEAGRKTKINSGNISSVINGRRKKAGGYNWIPA